LVHYFGGLNTGGGGGDGPKSDHSIYNIIMSIMTIGIMCLAVLFFLIDSRHATMFPDETLRDDNRVYYNNNHFRFCLNAYPAAVVIVLAVIVRTVSWSSSVHNNNNYSQYQNIILSYKKIICQYRSSILGRSARQQHNIDGNKII